MSEPTPVEAQSPAAPPEAGATVAHPQVAQPQGVSLLTALALSIACSAAAGYAAWHYSLKAQQTSQVAIFNPEQIVKQRMDAIALSSGLDGAQAAEATRKMLKELDAQLARYTDAGVVVINSNVVVNKPAGLDITADVARGMGVELK